MALEKISDKQKEILEFIKSEILNRGYPPSVRDICEGVHLKSTSSVHAHLETLERKGYIRRDPAKNRAIEIIDDSFGLQRREMVNVPLVGRVAAGEPILAVENIETYFPVPAEYMPNKQSFMLKVNGKRYVLFPEGGYKFNNKNKVQDFKAGSFKIALKSHVPIIPIALIDSYKVFNSFHFGPVTTQVHYLKPIEYDEYKDMKTKDIAALVKERIEEKIKEILG